MTKSQGKITKWGKYSALILKGEIKISKENRYFICANQEGQVLLSKPISTNQSFDDDQMALFISVIHDYEFESIYDIGCLDCGKITIRINRIIDWS